MRLKLSRTTAGDEREPSSRRTRRSSAARCAPWARLGAGAGGSLAAGAVEEADQGLPG